MQLMLIDIYQYFKEEAWVLCTHIGQNNCRKEFTDRENSLHPSYLSQKKSLVDFFGIICGLFENFLGKHSRNVQVSSNLLARREA